MPPIVAPSFRLPVYILLWLVAVVLLGLTAARINFTNKTFGVHEQFVVELLVASVLCVLWVPFSLLALFWNAPALLLEALGLLVLYTLLLAGSAIAAVVFPASVPCGGDRQCQIAHAILGFSWTAWALTFLLLALVALERWGAAAGGTGLGVGGTRKAGWGGRGRGLRAPAAV